MLFAIDNFYVLIPHKPEQILAQGNFGMRKKVVDKSSRHIFFENGCFKENNKYF